MSNNLTPIVPVSKPIIINCKIDAFMRKEEDTGNCNINNNTQAFFSLYNNLHTSFDDKFKSLSECFTKYGNDFTGITKENTLYLELLQNGNIKGIGKKFLDIIKNKALEYDYKYIFLYPSANFGENNNDREKLIAYYTSVGFLRLNSCNFHIVGTDYKTTNNIFDDDVDYILMYAKINDLNTTTITNNSNITINYQSKYLKYKTKYLELKKLLELKN